MLHVLLTCNIENANIFLGLFNGDSMVFDSQIATCRDKAVDEYAILISNLFNMNRVSLASVKGAIISSVVRPLNATLSQAIEKLIKVKPLLVGPGIKTGLNIKTDIPSQVGADIVASAVAAIALAKSPLILLDFGTATTLTGINATGELCGVLICPGVRSSLDALSGHAAELPAISLDNPRVFLGKNTIDSMVSGFVFGYAAMIDGLLDRTAAEWETAELTVIATGEIASKIIPFCRRKDRILYEPNLTLTGLKIIYHLNYRPKS
jgi:type III pantothenate kinase